MLQVDAKHRGGLVYVDVCALVSTCVIVCAIHAHSFAMCNASVCKAHVSYRPGEEHPLSEQLRTRSKELAALALATRFTPRISQT